jgi:DNA-binding XRE family transcriptional regulator
VARPLRQLTPDFSPAHRLGAELREYRCERGHSQKSLGDAVHVSRSLIGAIEAGDRISTAEVIGACDDELGAAGALNALWSAAAESRRKAGRPAIPAAASRTASSVRHAADTPVERALEHVERSWLVRLDRVTVRRGLTSVGVATDRGTWIRLEHGPLDEIAGTGWGGVEASAALRNVGAPSWINSLAWRADEPGKVWRADEMELVHEQPVSRDPTLTADPGLPPRWWLAWRRYMQALADSRTERVASFERSSVSAQCVAQAIEDVWADQVDPEVSEWACAHGDMTWRKLTRPSCRILGWDSFGLAPRGYDAAVLWSNSLGVPDVAARIWQERSADLESSTGIVMVLFALARQIRSSPAYCESRHAVAVQEATALLGRKLALRKPRMGPAQP